MTGKKSTVRQLHAGDITATIDPDHGGMLLAVNVDGDELLADRRAHHGPIPTYGSFLMAPWVGEMNEGLLTFEGIQHRLPTNLGRHAVHGLVFERAWEVERHDAATLVLRCALTSPWPFGGIVRQTFELDPHGLSQTAEIEADDHSMPVALGWHPWFRNPDPQSVQVRVDSAHYLELDDELIPTGRVLPVAGDVDLRDGPVLGDRRIDVVLIDAVSPSRLTLPRRVVQIDFDPAISTVVVYTAEGTVCVEPWSSWPDALHFSDRGPAAGPVVLGPHETLRRWMRWSWLST